MTHQQFSLLKTKRFAPLFWTQFLGAFNDNVFKNALIILLTYETATLSTFSANTLVNIAGAMFILPFLLFSATFGQLADKVEKSQIARLVKKLEIVLSILIAFALYFNNLTLLLVCLFLFGTHSTLFGPIKYSILPQHLKSEELVGGNGLVEMGTYLAILLGTILGGILISVPHYGRALACTAVFLIAISGWLFSRAIPHAKSSAKNLKIDWNVFKSGWQSIKVTRERKSVFLAILAISWFWFFGTFYFYQAPSYAKYYFGGNEHVATLIIACFAIGIGIGSLSCERLSHRTIEIGLVPLAALGLSIFTASLYFFQNHPTTLRNLTIMQSLHNQHHVWILADLIMLGVCSGLYNVPLYAFVQDRSKFENRARIIAGNNILNSFFMIAAAGFMILTLSVFKISLAQLFIVMAILNLCITLYIFSVIPEFMMRFFVWIVIRFMYRLTVFGEDNLPPKGAAIYACNHVSFVDVVVMSAVCKRPIRFLMDHKLFKALGPISYFSRAIPIASAKENEKIKHKAIERALHSLEHGHLIGIFPEGSITRNGELGSFKKGIEELVQKSGAPVVPMALRGLWGSFFSRKYGKAMAARPRRFWSKISLHIGNPIPAEKFSLALLEEEIQRLLDGEKV